MELTCEDDPIEWEVHERATTVAIDTGACERLLDTTTDPKAYHVDGQECVNKLKQDAVPKSLFQIKDEPEEEKPSSTWVREKDQAMIEEIYRCASSSQSQPTDRHSPVTDRPFNCQTCSKSYKHKSELTRHEAMHSGDKPHTCVECGKSFSRSSTLNQHVKLHDDKRLYACEDCGKSFKQKKDLTRHEIVHGSQRPFVCDVCDKGFKHKCNLAEHERVHQNNKRYKCDICGASSNATYFVKFHEKLHRKIDCKQCGESFHSETLLQEHIMVTLSGGCGRIYVTTEQDFDLSDVGTMPKDGAVEKLYNCDKCDKSFKWKQYLKVHDELIHNPGDKNHVCAICGKAFKLKTQLRKHAVIHSEDRPYKCTRCELLFKRKDHLANHEKTHLQKDMILIREQLLSSCESTSITNEQDDGLVCCSTAIKQEIEEQMTYGNNAI